jgi:uncharacterized protein DUF481
MKKILFSIILSVVAYNYSTAQILNFNKRNLQNDTVKWLGQINVFFTAIDQEVSVANMGYNVDVIRKFKKSSLMAISKLSFASSNSETLLSDGYAHIRAVFNRHKKLGEEVFGQIQYNAIRGLDDRNLVGAGFRYIILDKEKYGILAGSGVIQEWENWIYQELKTSTSIIKSSNYISLFGDVNEHFHFNIISYYQASFSSFFKPRVSLEINLNLNITEKLKFTSNFTLYYDKIPVVPIDNFVFKFKNGLGYRF